MQVLGLIAGEELLLTLEAGEEPGHHDGAEQNRDDSCHVSPLIAPEKRGLRGRRDLARVLRILLGDRLGAVERLRQLARDVV